MKERSRGRRGRKGEKGRGEERRAKEEVEWEGKGKGGRKKGESRWGEEGRHSGVRQCFFRVLLK